MKKLWILFFFLSLTHSKKEIFVYKETHTIFSKCNSVILKPKQCAFYYCIEDNELYKLTVFFLFREVFGLQLISQKIVCRRKNIIRNITKTPTFKIIELNVFNSMGNTVMLYLQHCDKSYVLKFECSNL